MPPPLRSEHWRGSDIGLDCADIKISKAEMNRLEIHGDAFHPEWNYTIRPRLSKSSRL